MQCELHLADTTAGYSRAANCCRAGEPPPFFPRRNTLTRRWWWWVVVMVVVRTGQPVSSPHLHRTVRQARPDCRRRSEKSCQSSAGKNRGGALRAFSLPSSRQNRERKAGRKNQFCRFDRETDDPPSASWMIYLDPLPPCRWQPWTASFSSSSHRDRVPNQDAHHWRRRQQPVW